MVERSVCPESYLHLPPLAVFEIPVQLGPGKLGKPWTLSVLCPTLSCGGSRMAVAVCVTGRIADPVASIAELIAGIYSISSETGMIGYPGKDPNCFVFGKPMVHPWLDGPEKQHEEQTEGVQ